MRFTLLAAMLPIVACQAPAVENVQDADITDDVRAEIEMKLARHADALTRQDLDTALDLYTEDAVVRPANAEPVRGHAELSSFFVNWWGAITVESVAYSTEELAVHGDRAYQIGSYEAVQRFAEQDTGVPDRGSFMIVWRRQEDGAWKYHRGIFNSSLPAAETITSKGDQTE